MHVSPRSHLTAGIAVLGAGALALAPIQPIPSTVTLAPQRVVENLAVELAASSIDPITPWVTTFQTAGANIATLAEFYLEKPFPILQTIGANIATYIEELGNGQGGLIPEQIWNNIVTFFEAPWSPGAQATLPLPPGSETVIATGEYISKTDTGVILGFPDSPSGSYNLLLQLLGGQSLEPECQVDGDCLLTQSAGVLNFLNTNFSGQLLGLLGPLLAPVAVLTRSFTAIGEFFEAGDVIGAINELINIPANLVNGVLNGAGFIDLTAIVSNFIDLPVDRIGLELGGLLNAAPLNGSLIDPDNPPTQYSGGVGFDSVSAGVDFEGSVIELNGLPNGWLGSVIGLGQFVSEQMLVTPPAPPTQAAAEPEAAKLAAPVDVQAPAEVVADAAPAIVEAPEPVNESAPVTAEDVAEVPAPVVVAEVGEASPVEIDVAEIEAAVAQVEAEVAEAEAPAVAEDSAPAAATSDDDSGDTGSRASDSRRGGRDAD